MIRNSAMILLLALLIACSSSTSEHTDKESATTDRRTEIRLQQYMVQGKSLYQLHCANCHQQDGQGLAQLYPPLAKADYLMDDLERAACIIKNGMTGEITVNGIKFNQAMPANQNLTPIEIAEIVTYISNSWGNDAGLTSTRKVSGWLKVCED